MIATPFHIISFDVPSPPNYGGIIDVFYKIKALKKAGAQIILHCFHYPNNNPPTESLEKYCTEVNYYKRNMGATQMVTSKLPFIVSSRLNGELLQRLQQDDFPILFEGIHTCGYLNHKSLADRTKIVRVHNIEHNYYEGLVNWETKPLKKRYLKLEASRLQKFEPELKHANAILSIAKMDVPHFNKYAKTYHVPPFYDDTVAKEIKETKKQVLFHGNLAVKENENAVFFILDNIAKEISYPVLIAGKDPSERLIKRINEQANVSLISNPEMEDMKQIIELSHISILLTFQQTGVKLKLLHSLQLGNHIIINNEMNDADLFTALCNIENSPEAIITRIKELMDIPFSSELRAKRKKAFSAHFNMSENALRIFTAIENA